MKKFLRCCDVIPGCKFIARGVNENEVIIRATRHAQSAHNIPWITPDLLRGVLAAIHDNEELAIVEG
ncbi:MAG TPA: DUF1059 domain-containing protein [Candidatus Acidoferrales bacterium]|nr:DUF1059 domain-containing protein [Candidatus Acidoferrales bacterium]